VVYEERVIPLPEILEFMYANGMLWWNFATRFHSERQHDTEQRNSLSGRRTDRPKTPAKTGTGGNCSTQGSHYMSVLKFKDFSRTFKDPDVAFSRTNSRRKFTAWTVLKQYLISISVITGQFWFIKTKHDNY